MMIQSIQELEAYQNTLKDAQKEGIKEINICGGTGCVAFGSNGMVEAFTREIERWGLSDKVIVRSTGCHGFCEKGPIVVISPRGLFYPAVKLEDIPVIVETSVAGDGIVEKLLFSEPATDKQVPLEKEIAFYAGQQRIVFLHNGKMDPVRIEEYLARDGYSALAKAVSTMKPGEVVQEIKDSGLRGRGGAGFPTGMKWDFCLREESDEKYLICNADEGDPGAFMDRSLLEGSPHVILEGMAIAGYAIGANRGIIYVRAEYPLAVSNCTKALEQAREAGFLGENILGTGFDFTIEIRKGAGAFVCGEETALIASLEGKRGMPRSRPPFPAKSGYKGKPTTINNVETLANVPAILLNGAQWYASIGTESSKGTKIFALAGKVNNNGLVEVPMGTSLRTIVFDIGGGIPGGKKFKAAQMGGPSGGCVPEQYLDIPIDYESVKEIGAIMGSGGLIVMDESTCMVDVARYFLEFTQEESCGKCVPCRVGTRQMVDILNRICEGNGEAADISKLEELAETVKTGSLCGLGQTAPNPVLTTLRFFRDEYEAHIREKTCPAKVCKALIRYDIVAEKCKACGLCKKACPVNAISGERKVPHVISQDLCITCGNCYDVCPFDAITIS
jgi:NADH:ubiquinone oxidoreductase subunit F (NADH-binding)/(2Fe-2S) ferredoxin